MAKDFDRNYKLLGQEDLRGLLYMFWQLPLDEPVEIEALNPEISLPGLVVDDCYLIRRRRGQPVLLHLECEHHWQPAIPDDTARYVQAIGLKWPKLPIESLVILLSPQGWPAERPPGPWRSRRGALSATVRYQVVKLWELDPRPVLASGRAPLLPWVMLMHPSRRQVQALCRRIANTGDNQLAARLLTLGRLNRDYEKIELLELLGRNGMLLKREILEKSDFIQDFLRQGREEGREEGGRSSALKAVQRVAAKRFPGLVLPDSLATLSEDELFEIMDQLYTVRDRKAATAALRGVSRRD